MRLTRLAPAAGLAAMLWLTAAGPLKAESKPDAKAEPGVLDVQSTAIPVISQGRLVNYVFVKLRLDLRRGLKATDYRPRLPFLRDALVRDSHRLSLAPPGNFNRLDEAVVRRTLLAEATRLIGPGVVTAVTITSQTPARLAGVPPRSPGGRTLIP